MGDCFGYRSFPACWSSAFRGDALEFHLLAACRSSRNSLTARRHGAMRIVRVVALWARNFFSRHEHWIFGLFFDVFKVRSRSGLAQDWVRSRSGLSQDWSGPSQDFPPVGGLRTIAPARTFIAAREHKAAQRAVVCDPSRQMLRCVHLSVRHFSVEVSRLDLLASSFSLVPSGECRESAVVPT